MELPNIGISFYVIGLTCSCKNFKCTLLEHYSGLIDTVFIKNVYFVDAEADLSKAFSLAVTSQIADTLKTVFQCKTNMSGNSEMELPRSFSVTTDCQISSYIYDQVKIKNENYSVTINTTKDKATIITFDVMNLDVLPKKLLKCPQCSAVIHVTKSKTTYSDQT